MSSTPLRLISCWLLFTVQLALAAFSPLDERIVGGRAVSVVRHPHQVSLRYKSCERCAYAHHCGGSIVGERVVVTAAHCVDRLAATSFVVVAGTENRSGSDGAIVPVRLAVMHEEYSAATTANDVAVVFLGSDIGLDNVTRAAVPLAELQPENGAIASVTGWGASSAGGFNSAKLLEVQVPVVGNDLCDQAYGGGRIDASMMCAGTDDGGKDSCQGDSGGPLVVRKQLAGIVSFGRGCARPQLPGVYASVAHLKEWIEQAIAKNS